MKEINYIDLFNRTLQKKDLLDFIFLIMIPLLVSLMDTLALLRLAEMIFLKPDQYPQEERMLQQGFMTRQEQTLLI